MEDHHTAARQAWVRSLQRQSAFALRVEHAKERMGERYLFHPANRVKRLVRPPFSVSA